MEMNDNGREHRGSVDHFPEPYGAAACLLFESLIHRLVERSILTDRDAIEIIEGAAEAPANVAQSEDAFSADPWGSPSSIIDD